MMDRWLLLGIFAAVIADIVFRIAERWQKCALLWKFFGGNPLE